MVRATALNLTHNDQTALHSGLMAALLAATVHQTGLLKGVWDLKAVTDEDKLIGDWRITVEKVSEKVH